MTPLPEFILAKNYSGEELVQRIDKSLKINSRVVLTKVDNKTSNNIKQKFPQSVYHTKARIITIGSPFKSNSTQTRDIVVITAGNSDQQTAEETVTILKFLGYSVNLLQNYGVSKINRLIKVKKQLRNASVVIAIAGMEASLATVVAGLVSCPVIAVPTSSSYVASFKGLTAFLSMVNSCVPGVTVVNIDNGFGAAIATHRIISVKS